jgi:hypothetical protein
MENIDNIKDLTNWLIQENFNFENFSINEDWKLKYEGWGLERNSENYVLFYFEKGERRILFETPNETDIIRRFIKEIENNEYLRHHYLTMFKEEKQAVDCVNKLKSYDIDCIFDKVLWEYKEKYRYRVFIIGPGIEKAKNIILEK